MINQELLDLLRCPVCVREKTGELEFFQETWLICKDCDRKYPVWEEIPIMLIDGLANSSTKTRIETV